MSNQKKEKKSNPFYENLPPKKDKQDKLMEVTSKYFKKDEHKKSFIKDLNNRREDYPYDKKKTDRPDRKFDGNDRRGRDNDKYSDKKEFKERRYDGNDRRGRENDKFAEKKELKERKSGMDFSSFLKTKGDNVYVKDMAPDELNYERNDRSGSGRVGSYEGKDGRLKDGTTSSGSEGDITRLNKYIAHCGICSRRKAAEVVKDGMVTVNGKTETNPAYEVQEGDIIKYNGKLVKPEEKMVYLLMNKPRNVITTASDEKGRKTVLDMVEEKVDVRVFPVGRLDRNTTGLLLITNDGELASKLSHPSNKVKKIYHVTLDKNLKLKDFEAIKEGLILEDGMAEVDAIDYIKDGSKNEVGIEIHIGKNRIVRRIFEHLGYEVERLDRIYYAGLTKKDLPRGWSRPLTKQEIIMLKHFTK